MSTWDNVSDEARYPDGPEEPSFDVNLICYSCNLSYWPSSDGWPCPECGCEGELDGVELEEDRNGFVALATGNPYLVAQGKTQQEALERLYATAKKEALS